MPARRPRSDPYQRRGQAPEAGPRARHWTSAGSSAPTRPSSRWPSRRSGRARRWSHRNRRAGVNARPGRGVCAAHPGSRACSPAPGRGPVIGRYLSRARRARPPLHPRLRWRVRCAATRVAARSAESEPRGASQSERGPWSICRLWSERELGLRGPLEATTGVRHPLRRAVG